MRRFSRHCFYSALLIGGSALLLLPRASQAQVGIYAMGSGGQYAGSGTAWGGTFGLYDNFVPLGPLKLGGDGRFFVQHHKADSTKLVGGLFGLRLALGVPAVPIRPYIQAEIGGVSVDTTSFAYQVQGGLDVTIFPHVDVRGEYGGGQVTSVHNSGQSLEEFGAGLVFRL